MRKIGIFTPFLHLLINDRARLAKVNAPLAAKLALNMLRYSQIYGCIHYHYSRFDAEEV